MLHNQLTTSPSCSTDSAPAAAVSTPVTEDFVIDQHLINTIKARHNINLGNAKSETFFVIAKRCVGFEEETPDKAEEFKHMALFFLSLPDNVAQYGITVKPIIVIYPNELMPDKVRVFEEQHHDVIMRLRAKGYYQHISEHRATIKERLKHARRVLDEKKEAYKSGRIDRTINPFLWSVYMKKIQHTAEIYIERKGIGLSREACIAHVYDERLDDFALFGRTKAEGSDKEEVPWHVFHYHRYEKDFWNYIRKRLPELGYDSETLEFVEPRIAKALRTISSRALSKRGPEVAILERSLSDDTGTSTGDSTPESTTPPTQSSPPSPATVARTGVSSMAAVKTVLDVPFATTAAPAAPPGAPATVERDVAATSTSLAKGGEKVSFFRPAHSRDSQKEAAATAAFMDLLAQIVAITREDKLGKHEEFLRVALELLPSLWKDLWKEGSTAVHTNITAIPISVPGSGRRG